MKSIFKTALALATAATLLTTSANAIIANSITLGTSGLNLSSGNSLSSSSQANDHVSASSEGTQGRSSASARSDTRLALASVAVPFLNTPIAEGFGAFSPGMEIVSMTSNFTRDLLNRERLDSAIFGYIDSSRIFAPDRGSAAAIVGFGIFAIAAAARRKTMSF